MSKKPFFYENTSPNIVIVPTVFCCGPPAKKPKLDKNVPCPPPGSALVNIETSNHAVTDQKCEKSVTNSNKSQPNSKQPTAHDNLLKSSVEKDIKKNSSTVEDLNKAAAYKTSSWASNYLRSIDQLPKIPIKLNLSALRKRRLSSNEATSLGPGSKPNLNSNCAPSEDTKKINKIQSNFEESSKFNYKPPFYLHKTHKNIGNIENKSNKGTNNLSLSNTENRAQYDKNKITTLNTNTDCQISRRKPENKNIIETYKKQSEPKGSNEFPKFSSTILGKSKHEAQQERVLSKSNRSSDYLKPIGKHYDDCNDIKQKDKNNSNILTTDKTLKILKNRNPKDSKLHKYTTQSAAQTKNDHLNLVKLPKLKYSDISDITCNKNKSLKHSKDYKNEDRSKKIARSDKNLCKTKCSKPSIESRIYKREDGPKNNYKDINIEDKISSSKKSRDLEIKAKSKKNSESKTKVQKLKSSKKSSCSSKLDAIAKDRSPSKYSVKSKVQVTANSNVENPSNKRIDEKFDLRTKLSRKSLSNYLTKLSKDLTRERIAKENREKIIITIQNEKDSEEMDLKDVYKTSPAKDSKQSPEKPIYNKVNVIINLICNQSVPHDHESDKDKNDNCGSTSDDLSFLEDFNVDEIAELLKHGENLTKQNNELDIGDICENNVNRHAHERSSTTERFSIENESEHQKATASLSQNNTLLHTAVVKKEICEGEDTAEIQEMTIQKINIKTEASEESQHEITNDFNSAVDTQDQNYKVAEQQTSFNSIIKQEIDNTNTEVKLEPENDLPEADIINLDSLDDDNRSDVTLVLSPTNEFKSSDLLDELIQNVGEIEKTENNAEECTKSTDTVNMTYSDSNVSKGLTTQNISEIDTETIEKIAEEIKNFSKDTIKDGCLVSNTPLLSSNEMSIQNVSEIETELKETEVPSKLEIEKAKEDLPTDCDTDAENIHNSVSSINVAKTENNTAQSSSATDDKKEFVEQLQNRMLSYFGQEYTVIAAIHTGKFSELYHCSKNVSGESYTVKIIKTEKGRHKLNVLKGKMIMNLQQDIPKANYNCVYVLKGFSFAGSWCFLMDYYPKNLKQALEENNRPFHINVVQNLARQLVMALAVLRNKNIVHSDIKPSHILLDDSNRRLKLGGFDEAYYVGCANLLPNKGTPSYRSPEVIMGYSADFSIDVWSTAVVFYEMVTGIQLFPGLYNNDILFKQMCTLGHMPFDMIQASKYKNSHFCGSKFKRRVGYMGQKIMIFNQIGRSFRLQTTIYNSYRKYWGKSANLNQVQDLEKLYSLFRLLDQMLVLNPNHRLAIEFVYADRFIFDCSF